MIDSDEGLAITVEQLARMARILEGTTTEVLPVNRQMFAVMAEGPLDQIQRLLDEINEYVGSWAETPDAAETHAA
jgi:hypothetical protein